MKKRIGDMTLNELYNVCTKESINDEKACKKCFLQEHCHDIHLDVSEVTLDEEIEIPDNISLRITIGDKVWVKDDLTRKYKVEGFDEQGNALINALEGPFRSIEPTSNLIKTT